MTAIEILTIDEDLKTQQLYEFADVELRSAIVEYVIDRKLPENAVCNRFMETMKLFADWCATEHGQKLVETFQRHHSVTLRTLGDIAQEKGMQVYQVANWMNESPISHLYADSECARVMLEL